MSSNTKAFSITTATPTVSLTAKTATYTGSAISANTATVTLTNSETYSGTITYTYYTNSSCTTKTATSTGASAAGGAPKDAGQYYVKASIAASGNYAAAESSCVSHKIVVANYAQLKTSQSSCTTSSSSYSTYYDTYYETLADALSGATSGRTICVLANTTETTKATVGSSKTLTLNFNSYTINESSNTNSAIEVPTGATLTLTGSGGITATSYTSKYLISVPGGTINIGTSSSDSLVIQRTKATSDMHYVVGNSSSTGTTGVINMKGGTVKGDDRIFYATSGQLNISGGTVENTRAALTSYDSSSGCTNSTLLVQYAGTATGTISGGTIKYTNPDYCARAILLNSTLTGTVNITGGTITGWVNYESTTSDVLVLGKSDSSVGTSPIIDASTSYNDTNYRQALIFSGTDVSPNFKYYDGTLKSRVSTPFNNSTAIATTPSGYVPATTYSSSIYTMTLTATGNVTYGIVVGDDKSCASLTTTSVKSSYDILTTMNLSNTVAYLASGGRTICAMKNNSETSAISVNKSTLTLNLNGKTITLGAKITVSAGNFTLVNSSSTQATIKRSSSVQMFYLTGGSLYVNAANKIVLNATEHAAAAISNQGSGLVALDGNVWLYAGQGNAIQMGYTNQTSTGNLYLGYNQGSNTASSDSVRPRIDYCNTSINSTCANATTIRIFSTCNVYVKYANVVKYGTTNDSGSVAIFDDATSGNIYIYDAAYVRSYNTSNWVVKTTAGANVTLEDSGYYTTYVSAQSLSNAWKQYTVVADYNAISVSGGGKFTMNAGIVRATGNSTELGNIYIDSSSSENTFKGGWIYNNGSSAGIYIKNSNVKFTNNSSASSNALKSGVKVYSNKGSALYFSSSTTSSTPTASIYSGYFITNSTTADVSAIKAVSSSSGKFTVNINTTSNTRAEGLGTWAAARHTQAILSVGSAGTVNIGSTSLTGSSYPKVSNYDAAPILQSYATDSSISSNYTGSHFVIYTPDTTSNKSTVKLTQAKTYIVSGTTSDTVFTYPNHVIENFTASTGGLISDCQTYLGNFSSYTGLGSDNTYIPFATSKPTYYNKWWKSS